MKNKEHFDLMSAEAEIVYKEWFNDKVTHENTSVTMIYNQLEYFKEWSEQEYIKPLLTKEEKKYIFQIIEPYLSSDWDIYLVKYSKSNFDDTKAYLYIKIKNLLDKSISGGLSFPAFPTEEKYAGMTLDKIYSLKELNLNKKISTVHYHQISLGDIDDESTTELN